MPSLVDEVPPPSAEAVEIALWGLRRHAPVDPGSVEPHYALIHLPFQSRIPFPQRPERFVEALRLAIHALPEPSQRMADSSFFGAGRLLERRKAAAASLRSSHPDWAETYTDETLERRAIGSLVATLRSPDFADVVAETCGYPSESSLSADEQRGYSWIEASQELTISKDTPTKQVWRNRFKIRAVWETIRTFYFDTQWSGAQAEPVKVPVLLKPEPRQRHLGIQTESQMGAPWNVHVVHLGRWLPRGHTAEIAFETELDDSDQAFDPFNALLASSAELEYLEFRCHLPLDTLSPRATQWDLSAVSPRQIDLGPATRQPDGSYLFRKTAPIQNMAYGIRWDDHYRAIAPG